MMFGVLWSNFAIDSLLGGRFVSSAICFKTKPEIKKITHTKNAVLYRLTQRSCRAKAVCVLIVLSVLMFLEKKVIILVF